MVTEKLFTNICINSFSYNYLIFYQDYGLQLFLYRTAYLVTLSPEEERLVSSWLIQKMPAATETMVEKWWQGICQSIVRRRLETAKNRIKVPGLSAGEVINLQKQILDLQEQLHDFCQPAGGGDT